MFHTNNLNRRISKVIIHKCDRQVSLNGLTDRLDNKHCWVRRRNALHAWRIHNDDRRRKIEENFDRIFRLLENCRQRGSERRND